jgi:dihydrofolate reductase
MKISIYMASSVNGMISNKRNVPDWLSPEYEQGFMAVTQKSKAVIMGKITYNILAPDYLPLRDEGTLVVLTRDLTQKPAQSNVVFTDKDPKKIVTMLEANAIRLSVDCLQIKIMSFKYSRRFLFCRIILTTRY